MWVPSCDAEACGGAPRAATLDGLLLRVIPSLLFSIPFYPMSGFQSAPQLVATFFGVLAVFSAAVGALSMAITVMFGSAGRASLVMNLVVLVSLLFAGLLVNVGALAPWVAWVPYLSTVYYGFQALVVNEFTGLNLIISVRAARPSVHSPVCCRACRGVRSCCQPAVRWSRTALGCRARKWHSGERRQAKGAYLGHCQGISSVIAFCFACRGSRALADADSDLSLVDAQAEGASIPISGVTFLHALKVETSNVLRNVAILDALWLGFFLLGIGLLYATLPRPLVVHKHKLGARARRSASTNSVGAPAASDSSDDF